MDVTDRETFPVQPEPKDDDGVVIVHKSGAEADFETTEGPHGSLSEHRPLVARNFQKWRTRRGLSVSALAREAGLSKSTISDLERGSGNPSLDTLWAIAKSLNISLGALFLDTRADHEPNVRRYSRAAVLTHKGGGHQARLILGWHARGELEIAFVTLDAGSRRDSPGNAPGVTERVLCVSGRVEAGPTENPALLAVGDLITFGADQPHFYSAIDGPAKLVVVQQYPDGS